MKGESLTILILLIIWLITMFINVKIAVGYGISISGIIGTILSINFDQKNISITIFGIIVLFSLSSIIWDIYIGIGSLGGLVSFFILSNIRKKHWQKR